MTRQRFFVCLGLLGVVGQTAAFAGPSEKTSASAQSVAAMSPMPAVRRVGILPARSNITAFREFMRNEVRSMNGFLSLPLTEEQVSREISQMVVRGVADSGRFWSLSMDSLVELSGVSPQAARDYSAAELRLYKAYDLDAWVEPELAFNPDHTRLRLTLRSARDRSFVLAREDILFDALPTSGEIEKNVHNALARVAATLAHDGRVTWRKNDLVVVDFGKERGLAQGTQLAAGYVVLSARHPVSQEYLRAQKIQTLELEVVEARDGSSVCRIIRRHPLMETEANNLVPGLTEKGLLAWRRDQSAGANWLEFSPSKNFDAGLVSGAEAGFRSDEKSQTLPPPGTPPPPSSAQQAAANREPTAPVAHPEPKQAPVAQPEPQLAPQPVQESADPIDKSRVNTDKVAASESGSESQDQESSQDDFNGLLDFSRWKPREASVGVGLAGGTLASTTGSLQTEFPPTVLNSVRASVLLRYSDRIFFEPEAYFHYFSGLVDGSRSEIVLPFSYVTMGNMENPGTGALEVGVGPTLLFGDVKAVRSVSGRIRTTSQTFQAFDAVIHGTFALDVPAFGEVRAKAAVAVVEVLQGEGAALEVRAQARPSRYVPKELSFFAGFRMGPGIWSGYDMGAMWTLKL